MIKDIKSYNHVMMKVHPLLITKKMPNIGIVARKDITRSVKSKRKN